MEWTVGLISSSERVSQVNHEALMVRAWECVCMHTEMVAAGSTP